MLAEVSQLRYKSGKDMVFVYMWNLSNGDGDANFTLKMKGKSMCSHEILRNKSLLNHEYHAVIFS